MKKLRIVLVVAILLFAVQTVTAQMGPGMGSMGMGGHGRAYDMWQEGRELRWQHGMHGMGFMHQHGFAYGQYVTFTVDDNGDVLDYGINGYTFFNIKFNFNKASTSTSGSVTFITGDTAYVRLHDNPSGVINIKTFEPSTITFELADGVKAYSDGSFIVVESDVVAGYLLGIGNVELTLADNRIEVSAEDDSIIIFRSNPVNMPMFGFMHSYNLQIANNRIGMEIAIGSDGTFDFVNYSRDIHLEIQEMQRERIRLLVSSPEEEGTILSINLDNTTLHIDGMMLRLYYDGTPLNCVDAETVLNATGNVPYCWISEIQDWNRVQCLMYIPNFSVHTIDFVVEEAPVEKETITEEKTVTETVIEKTEPLVTPGFELLTAVLAIALLTRFKKS